MSLKEVILEIAADMEEIDKSTRAGTMTIGEAVVTINQLAKQLRRVCKVAGDEEATAKKVIQEFLNSPVSQKWDSIKRIPPPIDPQEYNRVARHEMANNAQAPDDDPDDILRGQVSVPCVGGGSNGDHVVFITGVTS